MKKVLFLALVATLWSCSDNLATSTKSIKLSFEGEMLFDGANTLQAPAAITIESLSKMVGVKAEAIKKVGVKKAQVEILKNQVPMVESLLLQVVSNNNSLITVGTLSPVDKQGLLTLSLAEEIDVYPYLKDEGCTWVLDANIATDDAIDLSLAGILGLEVYFKEQ